MVRERRGRRPARGREEEGRGPTEREKGGREGASSQPVVGDLQVSVWRRERGSESLGVLRPKLMSLLRAMGPSGLDDWEVTVLLTGLVALSWSSWAVLRGRGKARSPSVLQWESVCGGKEAKLSREGRGTCELQSFK